MKTPFKPLAVAASGAQSFRGPHPLFVTRAFQTLLIFAGSGGLLWLVAIYSDGLRDPRYLDGWILTAGMVSQLYLHIANKVPRLAAQPATIRRSIHVLMGTFLIAAFLSHCSLSLPDTSLEWVLWTAFILVSASGIFGAAVRRNLGSGGVLTHGDSVAVRRSALARELYESVNTNDTDAMIAALPRSPDDAWIEELYATHLAALFENDRDSISHLVRNHRQSQKLIAEIGRLSRYAGKQGKAKLAGIKRLIGERQELDQTQLRGALSRIWLYVHVPATYALFVLSLLHILAAYAFSSGAW